MAQRCRQQMSPERWLSEHVKSLICIAMIHLMELDCCNEAKQMPVSNMVLRHSAVSANIQQPRIAIVEDLYTRCVLQFPLAGKITINVHGDEVPVTFPSTPDNAPMPYTPFWTPAIDTRCTTLWSSISSHRILINKPPWECPRRWYPPWNCGFEWTIERIFSISTGICSFKGRVDMMPS